MRLGEQLRRKLDERRIHSALINDLFRDPDILVEQRELERARILSAQDPFRKEILRCVRSSARSVDDLESDRCIDAEFCERRKSFSGGPDVNRKQRLIHRLHCIACTDVAASDDLAAESLEDRLRAINSGLTPAAHHGERSVNRALHSTAHRRVDEIDVFLLQPVGDAPGRSGIP